MRRIAFTFCCLLILWGCSRPPATPGLILAVQDGKLALFADGKGTALAAPGQVASPQHAALAPDGSYVAAVLSGKVWVHSLRGEAERSVELPAPPGDDLQWAPDAARFAYGVGTGEAVVGDLHGHTERITVDGDRVMFLSWGPGARLAIVTQAGRIWRWAPGETARVAVADVKPQPDWPAWSADGGSLVYVGGDGSVSTSGRRAVLRPEDVSAQAGVELVSPKWSAGGERIAAMAIHKVDGTGTQWYVATAGVGGGKTVVWTAPPHPCYVYGFWWGTGTDLLIEVAGHDCSKMVVLNGETGAVVREFPIPLKGIVRVSPDRAWVAVERPDRSGMTELIPLGRPEERVVVPLRGLAGWCCMK